jgi:hypothetical protein
MGPPEEKVSQPREPAGEESEYSSDSDPFETPPGPLVLKSRVSGKDFLEETLYWGEYEVVIRITTGSR